MKKINEIKSLEDLNEAVRETTSPLSAIRLKCLECSVFELTEVKSCIVTNCPLYPFRLGKNPYRKRELTDEQKEAMAERMLKIVKKQVS